MHLRDQLIASLMREILTNGSCEIPLTTFFRCFVSSTGSISEFLDRLGLVAEYQNDFPLTLIILTEAPDEDETDASL